METLGDYRYVQRGQQFDTASPFGRTMWLRCMTRRVEPGGPEWIEVVDGVLGLWFTESLADQTRTD